MWLKWKKSCKNIKKNQLVCSKNSISVTHISIMCSVKWH
ncbi:hypothetical protein vBEcoMWL3_gp169 [Escherichia phage vB_EcoM_WL-3]|nr:hypothetical protein vBEcoMWL3_gp169 [Escherichia phage vB_EcoM_WL-3]